MKISAMRIAQATGPWNPAPIKREPVEWKRENSDPEVIVYRYKFYTGTSGCRVRTPDSPRHTKWSGFSDAGVARNGISRPIPRIERRTLAVREMLYSDCWSSLIVCFGHVRVTL
jgi:hypothetical protein